MASQSDFVLVLLADDRRINPTTLLVNLGGSGHGSFVDEMCVVDVAHHVYAVGVYMKVLDAALAVTMERRHILATFEVGR